MTETWLTSFIYDNEILPSKFILYRRDRDSRGGGVLIAVNNLTPSILIPSPSNLEVVTVSVHLTGYSICLCVVYCPPNSEVSYFDQLIAFLHSLASREAHLLIIGDFNLADICWSSLSGTTLISNLFCDFVFEANLTQLITCPTHIKGNTLDIILTDKDHLVNNLSVSKSAILTSDHLQITFDLPLTPSPSSTKHQESLAFYNYANADFEGLCDSLLESDLNSCLQSDCIEQAWTFIKDTIHNAMDQFIPKSKSIL